MLMKKIDCIKEYPIKINYIINSITYNENDGL